ncbi:hypothetical protein DITRI_Ditri03aG0119800 [Diplodiscus trichospermus]
MVSAIVQRRMAQVEAVEFAGIPSPKNRRGEKSGRAFTSLTLFGKFCQTPASFKTEHLTSSSKSELHISSHQHRRRHSQVFSFCNLNSLTSLQKDDIHLYKMNFSAVNDVKDVRERHIEDSLAIISPMQNSYISSCNNSLDNLRAVDAGLVMGFLAWGFSYCLS